MPREMRLVDAESFADKLRPLLRIAEKKADERAVSMLTYVLDLLKDEPTVEKPKKDVKRHKYGEYKNVLLSDEEYGKLSDQFPKDLAQRIERLSEYIAQKGDKYKSHYAVIRTWARQESEIAAGADNSSFDTDDFFEAALKRTYGRTET